MRQPGDPVSTWQVGDRGMGKPITPQDPMRKEALAVEAFEERVALGDGDQGADGGQRIDDFCVGWR